jgi:hypothetical protein
MAGFSRFPSRISFGCSINFFHLKARNDPNNPPSESTSCAEILEPLEAFLGRYGAPRAIRLALPIRLSTRRSFPKKEAARPAVHAELPKFTRARTMWSGTCMRGSEPSQHRPVPKESGTFVENASRHFVAALPKFHVALSNARRAGADGSGSDTIDQNR